MPLSDADLMVSERDLLATVVGMAQAYQWMVHHTLDTGPREETVVCPGCQVEFTALAGGHAKIIGPGFPDLVLAQPPYLYIAELKSARGRLTTNQQEWQAMLKECTVVRTAVWRPSDLDGIERILAREDRHG